MKDLWEALCSWEHMLKAWKRVEERKGNPGIDNVSIAQFKKDIEYNLSMLIDEIKEERYEPQTALQFVIRGADKKRTVAIFTVRDRIVQQALMLLLQDIFEPTLSDVCYAYRRNRSALSAAQTVEKHIKAGRTWFFETDIKDFFDNIEHAILLEFLREKIFDDRIINLVRSCLEGEESSGRKIERNYLGASQGSALSPLLSNIYLTPLDTAFENAGFDCIRYSDDLVVLSSGKEEAESAALLCENLLYKLGLSVKKGKTRIGKVAAGFDFLGFNFRPNGHFVSLKSIEALEEKLSGIVLNAEVWGLEDTMTKIEYALLGWKNYFGNEIPIKINDKFTFISILNLVAIGKLDYEVQELVKKRSALTITETEMLKIIANYWIQLGYPELALLEYGRLLVNGENKNAVLRSINDIVSLDPATEEACLTLLSQAADHGSIFEDKIPALVELFCESGSFTLAKKLQEYYLSSVKDETITDAVAERNVTAGTGQKDVEYVEEDIETMLELFSGREGVHARQLLRENNEITYQMVQQPLDALLVQKHLDGQETLGTYLVRSDQTVKLLVIDIDISKKFLIQGGEDIKTFEKLLKLTHYDAMRIIKTAGNMGMNGYIEDSGYRGRHCWFFLENPVQVANAVKVGREILLKAGIPSPGIVHELFPGSAKPRLNQAGSMIKIPLGIHKKSHNRTYFLKENEDPYDNQLAFLRQVEKVPLDRIFAITGHEGPKLFYTQEERKPEDATGGTVTKQIQKILQGCEAVKYLASKAETTNYLNHRERIALLQTFGFLGDAGLDFLREIMKHCVNYNQNTTERYLAKIMSKPISCGRIREDMMHITPFLRCDCRFRKSLGFYPAPLLYAQPNFFKKDNFRNEPTYNTEKPASKTSPLEGEVEVLIEKIKNFRLQQKGIERSRKRCEARLNDIFDQLKTDNIETKLGNVTRENENGTVTWSIKL